MSDSQENQACSVLHLEPPSHFLEQFSPAIARHKLHIVKRSQTINVSNKIQSLESVIYVQQMFTVQ
jgi:hypothetical protein